MKLVLNDMSEYLEYDAEKTNRFIDDLLHVLEAYNSKATMLYSIYGRYCNNDTFVGESAEKSKLYISAHQKFLDDKYELQSAIYKKYCDIANTFSDNVDASPKARTKMPVLKKVKSDYLKMSESMEYHGKKIMYLAKELEDEFGEFADFETPDFASVICEFDEFCGSSGFLDNCINKFIEFDKWSSNSVDRTGFIDKAKNMQQKLRTTANLLDSMTVYHPNMAKNSIALVGLNAGVVVAKAVTTLGAAQASKMINSSEEKLKVLKNRYGFSSEEWDYLMDNHKDLLLSLYATSQYSSSDADIIYKKIKQCLSVRGKIHSIKNGKKLIFPKSGEKVQFNDGDTNYNVTVAENDSWAVETDYEYACKQYKSVANRMKKLADSFSDNIGSADLLQYNVPGYGTCYAGAMVAGYGDVGDIVKISLADGSSYNFIILDVKDTHHTKKQLADGQVQNEQYGHGYLINNNQSVSINPTEFMLAGWKYDDGKKYLSAKYYTTNLKLEGNRVKSAEIVGHIDL